MSSTREPTFRLVFGDEREPLEITDAVTPLGRHSSSRVCIAAHGISRRHAQIVRDAEGWMIQDLGSANGTSVNDERVEERRLGHGDRIALDTYEMRFEVVVPAASETGGSGGVKFASEDPRTAVAGTIDLDRFTRGTVIRSPFAHRGADWAVRLFSRAARTLLSGASLDDILERVMDLVFESLPAERGVLCLIDEETGTRKPRVVRSAPGVVAGEVRISQSIVNAAIEDRNAVLMSDARDDSRFSAEASIVGAQISTAMCAPLYYKGSVSGFIYVDSRSSRNPFDQQCLEVLTTLSVVSAVAVEQTRLREKVEQEKEIRARLARYSSPHIVEKIVETSLAAGAEMMAEATDVSVLFADIGGFTTLSEKMSPAEITSLLNDVFEQFTRTVFALDGTLDKFMGDGLMAIFGAPLPQEDHAYRAVLAAMIMQRQVAIHNSRRPGQRPLSIRVGVNSGQVIAGDIGSPERRDYTVIGDTVNVASRLESSVASPGQVVIGPETHGLVGARARCEPLGTVALKGRQQEVEAWLVVEVEDELPEVAEAEA